MALVKATLNTSIKEGLEPLIENKTKIAFTNAMIKFKEESEKASTKIPPNKDGVFTPAVNAAALEFSKEMKALATDIAKTVSDNVDTYIKAGVVNVTVTGVTVGAPSPHVITAQPGIGTIS
jgi:uncharacterized alkaline shock family protein YloU